MAEWPASGLSSVRAAFYLFNVNECTLLDSSRERGACRRCDTSQHADACTALHILHSAPAPGHWHSRLNPLVRQLHLAAKLGHTEAVCVLLRYAQGVNMVVRWRILTAVVVQCWRIS